MKCKQCGQEFTPGANLVPFCSDRCRLLDLGAWASEKYRIAGKAADDGLSPQRPAASSDNDADDPSKKLLH